MTDGRRFGFTTDRAEDVRERENEGRGSARSPLAAQSKVPASTITPPVFMCVHEGVH